MEEKMKKEADYPIAIIGAGPVGLAAAAHLAVRGEKFVIFEAGPTVGAHIHTWGHVQLFSPWRYNIDKAAKELLKRNHWNEPNLQHLPTGNELLAAYLNPLSELPEIKPYLKLNSKVVSVSKKGMDKMKSRNREAQPFVISVEEHTDTARYMVRAVIDCTGTWGNPNPVHSEGIWTKGEAMAKNHIYYGIPDINGEAGNRYIGKRIVVVGGGHSAINTLIVLAELKRRDPVTEIYWIMRKNRPEEAYGGEGDDQLEARGELGSRIHRLVDQGIVNAITPFYIQDITLAPAGVMLTGESSVGTEQIALDEIIVNTGSRPDFSFINELRLSIDQTVESAEALAPLIDPNVHSCGTVRPHGEKELRHAEHHFYIAGMKSYGRAPTFLMATGYEQVRSIAAYLAGDMEAALKVELELPETGVCSIGNAKPAREEVYMNTASEEKQCVTCDNRIKEND